MLMTVGSKIGLQKTSKYSNSKSKLACLKLLYLSVIVFPYPATAWCGIPPEDKTNKPLCRPLPVATKPPPPAKVRPPGTLYRLFPYECAHPDPQLSALIPGSAKSRLPSSLRRLGVVLGLADEAVRKLLGVALVAGKRLLKPLHVRAHIPLIPDA